MSDTERLKFKVKKHIQKELIDSVWAELSNELVSQYPAVKFIKMPKITGIIMDQKRYDRAQKRLLHSEHIDDKREMEYGNKVPEISSACVFRSTDGWMIQKCENRNSIEIDVRHELLHIFEDSLLLPWGKLTREEMKSRSS